MIVAERIDPLPAPLTPQQQADRPYALGTMEIVPTFETKFTKKSELSTFMLIYNPKTDAANKPDVTVEYNFFAKDVAARSRSTTRRLRTSTRRRCRRSLISPLGHQLQTGQAIPLASFPEGDYRLEIKVTDKLANKSIVARHQLFGQRIVNARTGHGSSRGRHEDARHDSRLDRVGDDRRPDPSVAPRSAPNRAARVGRAGRSVA